MTWKEIEGSFWTPVEDEEVIGVYTHKETGDYGKSIYTLDVNGKPVRISGTAIIEDRFDKIEIGSKVKIIYKGEKNTGKGNPLKLYSVYVEETEEE